MIDNQYKEHDQNSATFLIKSLPISTFQNSLEMTESNGEKLIEQETKISISTLKSEGYCDFQAKQVDFKNTCRYHSSNTLVPLSDS